MQDSLDNFVELCNAARELDGRYPLNINKLNWDELDLLETMIPTVLSNRFAQARTKTLLNNYKRRDPIPIC